MRIGFNLDDTICMTTEIVHDKIEIYASSLNLNPLDIMNDEDLKHDFFDKYMDDIYTNVEIKREASNIIRRLKNKGNEIYIFTSRSNDYVPSIKNVSLITEEWLRKNNVLYDSLLIGLHGEKLADACKRKEIDLMIDDNPYNYKLITNRGVKCLLYDDRGKYDLKDNYVTSWKSIEDYIERNR